MKIYLAADHAGFELKEKIKKYLESQNFELTDFGANEFQEGDDYPDYIWRAADAITQDVLQGDQTSKAVIFGLSGQGEAVVANRFPKVRATVYYGGPEEILKLSKEHNNSNILSLGAKFLNEEEAVRALKIWLSSEFSNEERHAKRIAKIEDYPNQIYPK